MCKPECRLLRSVDIEAQQDAGKLVHPTHGAVHRLAEHARLVERYEVGDATRGALRRRSRRRQQLQTARGGRRLERDSASVLLRVAVGVGVGVFAVVGLRPIESKVGEVESLDTLHEVLAESEAELQRESTHSTAEGRHALALRFRMLQNSKDCS